MRSAIACLAAALCCGAASAQGLAMSRDSFKAQQAKIEADYDAARARCKPLKGSPRDLCKVQARGRRDVQLAELDFRRQPTADAEEEVLMARAEAAYATTLQRCATLDGSPRDICRKDARAVFAGARAEAKQQKDLARQQMRAERIARERSETADKQLDAQYAAARERCEMLPAEGRENCLLDARRRFGRT
ncbi:MAG TPA: hypothetical protein VLK85_05355 [Ramlibacter sp.]|nr:hypothetical protein [Ramlibacter sp.]